MPPIVKYKAFAYITHRNRLLVFRQPAFPEAGIQVPAGTVHDGEPLDTAALREATEETGLTELRIARFLGDQTWDERGDGRNETHHRAFYHLQCGGQPPETWRHWEMEPSGGTPPVQFALFWALLPDGVPPLIAGHDVMVPQLLRALAKDAKDDKPMPV